MGKFWKINDVEETRYTLSDDKKTMRILPFENSNGIRGEIVVFNNTKETLHCTTTTKEENNVCVDETWAVEMDACEMAMRIRCEDGDTPSYTTDIEYIIKLELYKPTPNEWNCNDPSFSTLYFIRRKNGKWTIEVDVFVYHENDIPYCQSILPPNGLSQLSERFYSSDNTVTVYCYTSNFDHPYAKLGLKLNGLAIPHHVIFNDMNIIPHTMKCSFEVRHIGKPLEISVTKHKVVEWSRMI